MEKPDPLRASLGFDPDPPAQRAADPEGDPPTEAERIEMAERGGRSVKLYAAMCEIAEREGVEALRLAIDKTFPSVIERGRRLRWPGIGNWIG